MKLKYYKRSAVIFVSRIIPHKQVLNTPAACCENKFPKLALGFHTRDRMLGLEGIILSIYLNKQVILFFYNIG
jgi:hypothetical protein